MEAKKLTLGTDRARGSNRAKSKFMTETRIGTARPRKG